jgi:hypothetical protein
VHQVGFGEAAGSPRRQRDQLLRRRQRRGARERLAGGHFKHRQVRVARVLPCTRTRLRWLIS